MHDIRILKLVLFSNRVVVTILSVVLLVAVMIGVILSKEEHFQSIGIFIEFPYVFNSVFNTAYYNIHILSVLMIYIGAFMFDQKPYRIFLTNGFSRGKLFYFHQKIIVLTSLFLTFCHLASAVIIGSIQGNFSTVIDSHAPLWMLIFFLQAIALQNFALAFILIFKRSFLAISAYFVWGFLVEPVLMYVLAFDSGFESFYYQPFRTINKLSFYEHVKATAYPQPDNLINIGMAAAFIIAAFVFNRWRFSKVNY